MQQSVLRTEDLLTCVVCLVISEQGAALFHYPTSPSATKEGESLEHLAKEALASIKEAWTDEDEGIKDRLEDPRQFIFIPKLGDGSAYRTSIEGLVEDIANIFDPIEP
jgi:hypothetical protein